MRIAAIMPCRGRAEQTVANVRRLLATAGMGAWELWCVCDDDAAVYQALLSMASQWRTENEWVRVRNMRAEHGRRGGYWYALNYATEMTDATHLIGLANDLLPGQHWLRRAVESYQEAFGDGPGLLGFNGDSHEIGHSCHFLIDRRLLERYGGWPTWYQHNFGDTELCQRAIQDGLYAKAPWALLYHNHYYFGADNFDSVYQEGRDSAARDQVLYEQRRKTGWSTVPQTR